MDNIWGNRVPKGLRVWFVIHFLVDLAVALPLFIYPQELLTYFGWQQVDPIASRLVAAALFGIGVQSWIGRNAGVNSYKNMLNLKIIWSLFAAAGLALSLYQGAQNGPFLAKIGLGVFAVFNLLWIYWRLKL